MRYLIICFIFLGMSPLFCDEEPAEDIFYGKYPVPWFTGPLLTPSAHTTGTGHVNLQTYVNFLTDTGSYDAHWHNHKRDHQFHRLQVRVKTRIGLCEILDFYLSPEMFYNETDGEHAANFADLPIGLEIQLLRPKRISPIPSIKLSIRANIPSGRYQRLNPDKKRTQITGTGCWFPGGVLSISQIWHLSGIHYISVRGHAACRFGVPVSVKGFNSYGGDKSTRGTEYPGNLIYAGGAIEYSFSQNWVFACDALYLHSDRDRFSGKTILSMKNPSREEYSLAPAIEYNWSKYLGMIGGVWFTFAGRNNPVFITGMLSLNAYL